MQSNRKVKMFTESYISGIFECQVKLRNRFYWLMYCKLTSIKDLFWKDNNHKFGTF